MRKGDFPVDALPAWCSRHGVEVYGITPASVQDRGNGWVAQESPKDDESEAARPLLVVPRDVVISAAYVQQFACKDDHFLQLFDALGRQVGEPSSPK